jgi:hypothetical protein
MQRHHEMALSQMLDELYLEGAASILEDQLYMWFNVYRLSKKTVYKEILKRWEELCAIYDHAKNDVPKLRILDSDTSKLLIFRDLFKEGEKWISLNDNEE